MDSEADIHMAAAGDNPVKLDRRVDVCQTKLGIPLSSRVNERACQNIRGQGQGELFPQLNSNSCRDAMLLIP